MTNNNARRRSKQLAKRLIRYERISYQHSDVLLRKISYQRFFPAAVTVGELHAWRPAQDSSNGSWTSDHYYHTRW